MGLKEFKLLKKNLLTVAELESKEIPNLGNKLSVLEEEITIQEAVQRTITNHIESLEIQLKKAWSSSKIKEKQKVISDLESDFEKVKEDAIKAQNKSVLGRVVTGLIIIGFFFALGDTGLYFFTTMAFGVTFFGICCGLPILFSFSITASTGSDGKILLDPDDFTHGSAKYEVAKKKHDRKITKLQNNITDRKSEPINNRLEIKKRELAKVEVLILKLKIQHGVISKELIESKIARDKLVAEVAHLIPFSSEIL